MSERNVHSVKYVHASVVFEGLPLALEEATVDSDFTFGEGNTHSLVTRADITQILEGVIDNADEDTDRDTLRQIKRAIKVLCSLPEGVLIDLEG